MVTEKIRPITHHIEPYTRLLDFGGYVLGAFALFGITGAVLIAWLSGQIQWFWEAFGPFGVAAVGVIFFVLIGMGLSIYNGATSGGKSKLGFVLVLIGIVALVGGAIVIAREHYPRPTTADVSSQSLPSDLAKQAELQVALNTVTKERDEARQQLAARPPSVQPLTPPASPVSNAVIGPGYSAVALQLTGTYARGGKDLKFVTEFIFDTQGRGENPRPATRIRIGASKDFVKGEAVKVPILSYLNAERSGLKWGPEEQPVGGIENSTLQFTWWAQVKIIAIDEHDEETTVIGFTLFPKHSGQDQMNEMQRVMADQRAKRGTDQPPAVVPKYGWDNFIIYPEGTGPR
jgi:hypothetical protein